MLHATDIRLLLKRATIRKPTRMENTDNVNENIPQRKHMVDRFSHGKTTVAHTEWAFRKYRKIHIWLQGICLRNKTIISTVF